MDVPQAVFLEHMFNVLFFVFQVIVDVVYIPENIVDPFIFAACHGYVERGNKFHDGFNFFFYLLR